MRTILERYLERENEYGDLVQPGSPAYQKALEVTGIGGKENSHTYLYELVEMRLVRCKYPHYVMHLHGGRNAFEFGCWPEYLRTQVRLLQSAINVFGDAWVCMMDNNLQYDKHELIIGVKYNKELEVRNEKETPPQLFAYACAEQPDYRSIYVPGQPVPAGV